MSQNGGMLREFVAYESINVERANAIADRFVKGKPNISRAEVVVTETCNLRCSYCRKRRTEFESEERIDKDILIENIESWGYAGCEYLHLTGGEVTLVPYLPSLVAAGSKKGTRVTISTNGTAPEEFYYELVVNGLRGVHLSLDTEQPEEFDSIVGVEGTFKRVLDTARLFTKIRDEDGYDILLTINTSVMPETLRRLPQILEFALSLRPGDIKLMPIAQLKHQWPAYRDFYYGSVYPRIEPMIPQEGFPMLRSRVRRLVEPSIRGYGKRRPSRCYLMSEERTIDPQGNYYGCYINYRENGERIGNIITDSIHEQTRKLQEKAAKLEADTVCQNYCSDITVMCNFLIEKRIMELRGE